MKKSFGEILIRLAEIAAEVYTKTTSEEPFSYENDGTKKKLIVPNVILIPVISFLAFIINVLDK
ncbi:hypothetical protein ACPA0F_20575 [Solibacillus silvestris]